MSKINQQDRPDMGGQFESRGVPDRKPRMVVLVFRAGEATHRHEFDAITDLAAVMEMAREKGASIIAVEEIEKKSLRMSYD